MVRADGTVTIAIRAAERHMPVRGCCTQDGMEERGGSLLACMTARVDGMAVGVAV